MVYDLERCDDCNMYRVWLYLSLYMSMYGTMAYARYSLYGYAYAGCIWAMRFLSLGKWAARAVETCERASVENRKQKTKGAWRGGPGSPRVIRPRRPSAKGGLRGGPAGRLGGRRAHGLSRSVLPME